MTIRSEEEKAQEDLSWLNFCPVCKAELIPVMRTNREYNLKTYKYDDLPPTVGGKDCPEGHGQFSVDYDISFGLIKKE